jgi:hypothetical protein
VKKTFLLVLIMMFAVPAAQAQYGPKATYRFLNIPISAQAAALGGGPVSLLVADPAQMHMNPAWLQFAEPGTVSTSLMRYLSEASMGVVSGVLSGGELGNIGVGIRFLNYGEMDRIDALGRDTGTFTPSDMAIKVGLARSYANIINYGVAVDFIHSAYDAYRSSGVAVTAGILIDVPDQETSVGLSVLNAGSQLSSYDNIRENLPFDVRLGVTRKLLYLPLRLSFTAHNLHRWEIPVEQDGGESSFFDHAFRHLAVGGEFMFSENFHFRLGYNHLTNNELKTEGRIDLVGFSFGVGINIKSVGIDISRNSYSEVGQLLQIGLRTRF